jgi:hypothetical protein
MATVNDFLDWLDKFGYNRLANKIKIEEDGVEEDSGSRRVRLSLYTQHHRYAITAINSKKEVPSYLGCIGYTRAPYAGENHIRSYDLSDGRLTKETWQNIKDDILAYELVNMGSAQFNPKRV